MSKTTHLWALKVLMDVSLATNLVQIMSSYLSFRKNMSDLLFVSLPQCPTILGLWGMFVDWLAFKSLTANIIWTLLKTRVLGLRVIAS